MWVSPPVMGLIQLSSASRIKKEVLLSLCLLFPCVVCSIITRCTHTLFGGWWGVLGTISFHLKCCAADLQKKKIITHCGFCPLPPVSPITSITNRPLCIYVIYFSTLITSSRRRVTEGDSFKKSVAVASTFQITDCICPADLISLQSPCRADQKPFKDLFMKRYLTYSISPAVALACQLHWMMADQTTAVEAIAL